MEDDVKQTIDPSSLTIALMEREIASLEKLLSFRIDALDEKLNDKIRAILDGIKIAHDDLERVPTDLQEKVGALERLLIHKIEDRAKLVDEKFDLIEVARVEQKRDSITSINKSEQLFVKMLDQQGNLIALNTERFNEQIATITKVFYDQFDDIKKKLTTYEGIALGVLTQKTEQRGASDSTWKIVAVIGMLLFGILGYVVRK